MALTTPHFRHRLYRRFEDPGERDIIMRRAEDLARRHPRGSVAKRVLRLPEYRNARYSGDSNGDDVWVVVRDGQAYTVMLRCHEQNNTPERLKVDTVLED